MKGEQSGCLLAVLRILKGSKSLPVESGAGRGVSKPPPFRRKDYLLTKAEREFHDALMRAVTNEYVVFAKVRLADLLWMPKGTSDRRSWFNRIQAKHVDFVVCDRAALRPLVAIELDDSSHDRPNRVARDEFVDAVLKAAELPLVRFRVTARYDPLQVRQQLEAAIQG